MVDMIVPPALAEKIRQIAAREQRSVEDVLNKMVEQYADTDMGIPPKVLAALRESSLVDLPSENPPSPPMSEETLWELAQQIGAKGTISDLIIEERKQRLTVTNPEDHA